MHVVEIIAKKRDGQTLSKQEIEYFIHGVVSGAITDYQTAAWLMAVYIRGMTSQETVDLTLAMANSGDVLDLHDVIEYAVDKHSSGGVGDKTSLAVLPLVAACGVPLAKMSGRGLGFSGGTIDKLESIRGFRVNLSGDEFREQIRRNQLALVGQSLSLAPADGVLYALRDVTATVSSLPLIASSIMSKKIAAGADGIVLDVKTGSGAFMKTLDEAHELAEIMVQIGRDAGRDVTAVLSDMNQPLGEAVGNALEVEEAIKTLRGEGPEDFLEHCLFISSEMLKLAGRGEKWTDDAENRALLEAKIANGEAFGKLRLLVESQGGDVAMIDDPSRLPQSAMIEPYTAVRDGYLAKVEAMAAARAAFELGAGREKKTDAIDHAVGVKIYVKQGDQVSAGQELATIYANDPARLPACCAALDEVFTYSDSPVERLPLFYDVLRSRQG